jgi:hypothetical protein
MRPTSRTFATLLTILVPLGIYLTHASRLGPWIVDDAAISFAYARSLAQGHGLVSQPGAVPVEGFTNLLWVLIVSGTMKLGLFDLVVTPKVLAALAVAGSFWLTARLFSGCTGRPWWLGGAALGMTAASPGFAIWCASGMENSLYALATAVLAWMLAGRTDSERARSRCAALAGLVVFLVFCTRPDGALYFWLPPLFLGLAARDDAGRGAVTVYVVVFAGLWSLLTLLRLIYFHDVLPNTFYAKAGEGSAVFAWMLARWPLPLTGVVVLLVGSAAMAVIAHGCHAVGRVAGRRVTPEVAARHAAVPFFLTAIFAFLALRGDWMPEYRFATPAFLFGPAAVLGVVSDATRGRRAGRIAVALIAAGGVAAAGFYGWRRTTALGPSPALSVQAVQGTVKRITQAASHLDSDIAVLTPDVGGALWEHEFRVVDLMGLIDRPLGRTVGRSAKARHDYLLHELKPEGIHVHSHWRDRAGLDLDGVFEETYAPVWEERPADDAPPTAGFYLRRDLRPSTP